MSIRVPKYRHHKASGQAIVTLSGHDHYLGPHDSPASHSAYEKLVAEWLGNGRQLVPPARLGTLSVNELLAAYLAFAESYYSRNGKPTSEYVAVRDAMKPVRELYGRTVVRDFGPLALKAVREKMIQQKLARRHINQRVNRVRRVFKWGVENELVPPLVLEGLRAVAPLKKGRTEAKESPPIRPVPIEHVDAVIPHVSRQVAAMIQLQILTGMRSGEVVLMRPCDVDQTEATWVFRPQYHKTDYLDIERTIYLGPQAQEILRPWLHRDKSAHCFSPAEAEAERNLVRKQTRKSKVTPSQAARHPAAAPKRPKRERYDRDSYRRAIEYGIKKAVVPHWHPHQLRHLCATRVRAEFGLDSAQVILGHQSASITETYAEANRAKAIKVIGVIG